jgi:5'-3' exonuclease
MSDEQLKFGPKSVAIHTMQEIAKSARINKAKRVYFFLDSREGSWRKKVFSDYKAQREEVLAKGDPAEKYKHDLADVAAKDIMPVLIPLVSCPVFVFPYLEADDLCAAATQLNPNVEGIMVTSDRDYWQLITPKISMFNCQNHYNIKMNEFGKLVKEMGDGNSEPLNLTPSEYLLAKVMQGDKSDNIPGLIGVGKETAANVVQEGRMVTFLAEQTGMITPRKHKVYNPNPVPVQQDATAVVRRNLMLMTLGASQVTERAKEIVASIEARGIRGFENNFSKLSLWIEMECGYSKDQAAQVAKILSETFQGVWIS